MQRKHFTAILAMCSALLVTAAGCDRAVQTNLALGLREGTLTAVQGIIEDVFNRWFGLDSANGDAAADQAGGGDLFIGV